MPKLRSGSYFPGRLLEPRRRAGRAMVAVVAQVSEMAKTFDAEVEAFRSRPLDGGPYTYVLLDLLGGAVGGIR